MLEVVFFEKKIDLSGLFSKYLRILETRVWHKSVLSAIIRDNRVVTGGIPVGYLTKKKYDARLWHYKRKTLAV